MYSPNYLIFAFSFSTSVLLFILFLLYAVRKLDKQIISSFIATLLLLNAIRFLILHFQWTNTLVHFPDLFMINGVIARIGILIAFFLVLMSVKKDKLEWYHYLHLIIPVLYIYSFSDLIFISSEDKVAIIKEMELYNYDYVWKYNRFTNEVWLFFLKYASLFGYLIWIIYALLFRKKNKPLSKSIHYFLLVMFFLLLISFVPVVYSLLWLEYSELDHVVVLVLTNLLIISIYFIPDFIYAPTIFERRDLVNGSGSTSSLTSPPIIHSKSSIIIKKLENYFEEERPFLNPNFGLTDLERHFGITGRYISTAIKEEKNMNFSNFLNHTRITYLVEVYLKEDSHRGKTMDQIANEIGFATENNFFVYFKKIHGMTPKKYFDQFESQSYLK
jgi:AraC-like DNA-binding protein